MRAASELRLSTRQVYNYLARYREERRASALLPRRSGTRKPRINPEVENIIAVTLREMWLRPEQPDLAPIVEEIRTRCAEEGHTPPAYVTAARRIPILFAPEEIARRRLSDSKHLHRLKARPGYIRADHALDVVQIDHTPADIQFVEVVDDYGVFVGRLYLTIAADVATSAIIGFCLTLERPSRLSSRFVWRTRCAARLPGWQNAASIMPGQCMVARSRSSSIPPRSSRAAPSAEDARTMASPYECGTRAPCIGAESSNACLGK